MRSRASRSLVFARAQLSDATRAYEALEGKPILGSPLITIGFGRYGKGGLSNGPFRKNLRPV
jgi:hypothetical protein